MFPTARTGHVPIQNVTLEKTTFQPSNIFGPHCPRQHRADPYVWTACRNLILLITIAAKYLLSDYDVPGTTQDVLNALTHLIIWRIGTHNVSILHIRKLIWMNTYIPFSRRGVWLCPNANLVSSRAKFQIQQAQVINHYTIFLPCIEQLCRQSALRGSCGWRDHKTMWCHLRWD